MLIKNIRMNMNSYVSILTTDHYVLGILVLYESLQQTKPKYPFHCLVTPNLSDKTLHLLKKYEIPYITIHPISNPHNLNKEDRRYYNYSIGRFERAGKDRC